MHITYRCKFPSCGDVPNNEESVKSVEQGEPPISTPSAPQCSIPGTHATGSSSMAHVGTKHTDRCNHSFYGLGGYMHGGSMNAWLFGLL